jgi:glycosyltransferase involved in cell wall biosynthesis
MADLPFLSIVIPMRNSAATIEACLAAATSVDYPKDRCEVIVVNDGSTDDCGERAARFDVQVVTLPQSGGAGAARNRGADQARGDYIFFTDSDCVVPANVLRVCAAAIAEHGDDCIIGGTYTPLAHDHALFNSFQSVFVNYSETKYPNPDYIATHAMLLPRSLFEQGHWFKEQFLPILEDVEFCHRLRREGVRLVMHDGLVVAHIFRFSLWRSMRNAYRKSRWWTRYHLQNKDALADSGTASFELKSNVALWGLQMLCWAGFLATGQDTLLWAALAMIACSILLSRRLLTAYFRAGAGAPFAIGATLYYLFGYPVPVAVGSVRGLMSPR